MNYLKIRLWEEDVRVNLTDDGINLNEGMLKLTILGEGRKYDDVNLLFSNLEAVTIYGCIGQEDGTETDEFQAAYYPDYTKLSKIEYDLDGDYYTVSLTIPNALEERVTELEDAINFLLMGGEE